MHNGMGCMQNEGVPSSGYSEIRRLMETGEPVCITFETEEGDVKKASWNNALPEISS